MGIKVTHSTQQRIKQMPAGQKVRPFDMKSTPFDPRTGKYLPLQGKASIDDTDGGIVLEVAIMIVVTEQNDYLVCYDLSTVFRFIAKPYLLRRTPFDGETVNSVSYVYSAANTRVASADGESDETQVITPSYYLGEQIIAVAHATQVETEEGDCKWEDLNTAGRSWAVQLE